MMLLHHDNLSICDRKESFDTSPSGAVAGGCPKGEVVGDPNGFIMWFIMSACTMESRLFWGGEYRVARDATVPICVELDHAVAPVVIHKVSLWMMSGGGIGRATLCVRMVVDAPLRRRHRMLTRCLIATCGILIADPTRPWVGGLANASAAKHR